MSSGDVNKVILVGNVGAEPEIRYMPSGDCVASLPIGTSKHWKDKNTGQPQEKTEWTRVVFFKRLAEVVEQHVHKGGRLYIEGELRTRSWEQDGVKRYATEVVARDMKMQPDGKQRSSGSDYSTEREPEPPAADPAPAAAPAPDFDNFDDDIPF
ncbi:single-stranded DNA-binding protein [Pseudohongiella spirulinae]|uniref:Single-stranded DNA-binding protein n=1 Tax=Pseudohongiella spirulinae TaxID=1249552 RepID=A0A0S2KER9_9GAMM|nr:single-stranded DNA-binding protein [Pseudohongiella spirulinae]ALO46606.1 single-stranded DNA-binding protein [Pseudohongiella spirulinae]